MQRTDAYFSASPVFLTVSSKVLRAREDRRDREGRAEAVHDVHRRLRDADDRFLRDFAARVEAGIAPTRVDERVVLVRVPPDLL
nr:hypothetical protein [Halarchaeum nitratireducens]